MEKLRGGVKTLRRVQRWKRRDQIVSVRIKEEKEARQILAGDEGGVCVHRERRCAYTVYV